MQRLQLTFFLAFHSLFAHNKARRLAPKMALTKRQKQVMDVISSFVQENGYSPSYEEIARALSLSSLATVHKHISALETKNYLKRGFNQSRSIDIGPRYLQEQKRD